MAQEDGAQESSHSQESKNSKDAFFDSKPKPKIIRILTVLAYILSVSMAAIILSVYYIFMWHGEPHLGARRNVILNYNNYSVEERFIGLKYLGDLENQSHLILHNYDDIRNANATETKLPKNGSEENEGQILCSCYPHIFADVDLLKHFFNFLLDKMSYKANNGLSLTTSDSGQWKTASVLDTAVKLAGEEAKDRLYEPKHKKKIVRVLTVVAYVFFVSLAAIMLSLYYVLFWNGDQKITSKYVTAALRQQAQQAQDTKCILDMQRQLVNLELEDKLLAPTEISSEENATNWQEDYPDGPEDLSKTSVFIKKLFYKNDRNI
ncbi:unnamed protein product [Phyllotreta striolata]|uniref:Uncharacterized protein n=1 Tax=Phyllotreta striolata TaxID=444603 RepID=A0A9N9TRL5_PHYSR|nr:unnamed protein product [Phyllotreta striolata]